MIEKNFKYNIIIYQLLSAAIFLHFSFISKHGYDWLNADKQLDVLLSFCTQMKSIVIE